jgi:hypothetical protein
MFRRLVHLLEYLFRRRRLEGDLDEELRSSFEMMVDQLVARGMPLAEARRTARLEFEGLDQVKEKCATAWSDLLSGDSFRTRATPGADCAAARRSHSSRWSRWPWESASIPRCSAYSTPYCCARCLTETRSNSCSSGPACAQPAPRAPRSPVPCLAKSNGATARWHVWRAFG